MNLDELLGRFSSINSWSRGSERAPHKPLLVLLALGRRSHGDTRPLPYTEIAEQLESLLRDFGPTRAAYRPEYPFWRLQNDGVWAVESEVELVENAAGDVSPTALGDQAAAATGHFAPEIEEILAHEARAVRALAEATLESNFPPSLHESIVEAVGLDIGPSGPRRGKKRDPRFRDMVLAAYRHKCAVCGFDLRVGSSAACLEAAHIMWHQAGGPDTADNGLALCSVHHKLFDLGAYTVAAPDSLVLVSEYAHGPSFEKVLQRYHGKPVVRSQRDAHRPNPGHLSWHRREVFRGAPID